MTDLRQACDRCHSRKVRCPKDAGSARCTRCSAAGADCIFSPPTRPSYRQDAPNGTQSMPLFSWSDADDVDQLMNGLDDYGVPGDLGTSTSFSACNFLTGTASQSSSGVQSAPTGAETPSAEGDLFPPYEETRQLTEIMLALDGITRKLPTNQVTLEQAKEWINNMGRIEGLQEALERILHYSQRLVATYPTVMKAAASSRVNSTDGVQNNENNGNGTGIQHDSIPPQKLDHALINLLMACHHRLLDVFDVLIGHGNMCGQITADLHIEDEPHFEIPEARIGSFVVPKGAAASMFLTTVVEMHAVLVKRSKELGNLAASTSGTWSREGQVFKLQSEMIQGRTKEMIGSLTKLRTEVFERVFAI